MSKQMKILIVDDESTILETLSDVLEMKGYDVATAINGEEAISAVKVEPFKVILMDYRMPGMNGVETFKEIRRINPDAQAIFISGFYKEECLNTLTDGVIGICQKPLDIRKLLAMIEGS